MEHGVKYPLASVLWRDSASDGSWSDPRDVQRRPSLCLTVGFVVSEGDDHVTLAASVGLSEAEEVANTTCIPRECVVRYEREETDA